MLTSTCSSLFRFLSSLVIRLRLSVGRIAFTFQARFASLWRVILTFACRRGQSQIRLHANDVSVVDNKSVGERPQISEREKAEGEDRGTLAVPPVGPTRWEDKLSTYRAHASSHQFTFNPNPATPDKGSQRYKSRKVRIRHGDDISHIPVGQKKLLSALAPLPEGWRRHVHPEGNVFFYHERLRIFTESNVIHQENEILFYATKLIQQAIDHHTDGVTMDELTEIVLNMDDDDRRWYYYFVDHTNRLLFWVHPVDLREDLRMHLQGITEYDHIRYLVEARYWSHCEYYPHGRTIPTGVFEDLRGMLNYAKTDVMTAGSSTSPFTEVELVSFLDSVNSLKADMKISDHYSVWIIARLIAVFTDDQFMNFSGQPCARLNADTQLFDQQLWNRSIIFKVVNVFLLRSPNEHAVRLQRVWVDGTIILPRWKGFIDRLTLELTRYPIFSTVMLAVNISFLAVPGVITLGSPATQIEIIIYCSVVCTIGSIIFSFALSNVYSDPALANANTAADVMETLSRMKGGMACLAITHSLPIACLVWSITLFSTALAIQIFSPKERATIVTLGVECFILVLFGAMSRFVMQLFARDEDVEVVDPSAKNNPATRGQEHHV
ncbi:hypothetical protein J3R82DRAFT_9179 [Butyriboletus roseoflavus]|nr:hypothetical protein J3R82DRAFT_9179 [Butyriboletus roseoflavus]